MKYISSGLTDPDQECFLQQRGSKLDTVYAIGPRTESKFWPALNIMTNKPGLYLITVADGSVRVLKTI